MHGVLLVFLLLLVPAAASLAVLFFKRDTARKIVVSAASCVMIVLAAALGVAVLAHGPFSVRAGDFPLVGPLFTAVDAAALAAILFYGVRLREWKVIVPAVLQVGAVIFFEGVRRPPEPENLFVVDNLSLIMTLIVSVIGPLVAIFAIGYMKIHEEHKKVSPSRQPRFFAVIFLFLFAMNGLCMTDNLAHLYAFFEVTTLCSFLLIGHDRTDEAKASARRALWLNSLGGLFFAAGILFLAYTAGTLSISGLLDQKGASGLVLAGILLLCCAGFVKSAQLPFQSWLLGAMVAPTPVSALLHSSTMVKAGVYIIVRLSPLFGGTRAGAFVSVVGAFTFASAAALAISQSNGKRVLAYSTISNLGLIIACAGIGGQAALTTAILLIVFHAVSKGLLFLCMGTVELKIGSRNIEDMFGIWSKMPYTATIMILGMMSMALPPFGVLLTKWLAIEVSANLPPVLLLLVLGSAFTVAFWVKWLGAVTTVYRREKPRVERLPASIKIALGVIAVLIPVLTAAVPALNRFAVAPAVEQLLRVPSTVQSTAGGLFVLGANGYTGGFGGVLLLLGLLVLAAVLFALRSRLHPARIVPPYACGTLADEKGRDFVGPQGNTERVRIHNYYLTGIFGEGKLAPAASVISALLILIMFGVA